MKLEEYIKGSEVGEINSWIRKEVTDLPRIAVGQVLDLGHQSSAFDYGKMSTIQTNSLINVLPVLQRILKTAERIEGCIPTSCDKARFNHISEVSIFYGNSSVWYAIHSLDQ